LLPETGAQEQQEEQDDCRELQDEERQGTIAALDQGSENKHRTQDGNARKSKPCFR
jgi:hypothetical protein